MKIFELSNAKGKVIRVYKETESNLLKRGFYSKMKIGEFIKKGTLVIKRVS